MGRALIVIGLAIAYLCWVTKRGGQYLDERADGVVKRRAEIKRKLDNNEKLTRMELLDWYVTKIVYGSLTYGIYGGFSVSIIGLIMLLINK